MVGECILMPLDTDSGNISVYLRYILLPRYSPVINRVADKRVGSPLGDCPGYHVLFVFDAAVPTGPWPPHSRGF